MAENSNKNNTELLELILNELKTQRGQEKREERQERKQKRRESAKKSSKGLFSGKNKLGKALAGTDIGKAGKSLKDGIQNSLVTGLFSAIAIPFIDGFVNTSEEAFGKDATLGEKIIAGFSKLFVGVLDLFGKKLDAADFAKNLKKNFDSMVEYFTSEDGLKKHFDTFKKGIKSIGKMFEKMAKVAGQIASGDYTGAYATLMSDASPGADPSQIPPYLELPDPSNALTATKSTLNNKIVPTDVPIKKPKPNFKVGDVYEDAKGRKRIVTGFNQNTGKAFSGFARSNAKVTTDASKITNFNSKIDELAGSVSKGTKISGKRIAATGARKFLGNLFGKLALPLEIVDGAMDAYNTFDISKGNFGEAIGVGVGSVGGSLAGAYTALTLAAPAIAASGPFAPVAAIGVAMAGSLAGEYIGEQIGGLVGSSIAPDLVPTAPSQNSSSFLNDAIDLYSATRGSQVGAGAGTGGNTTIIQDNSQKSSVSMNSGTMKPMPGFTDALESWMVR